MSIMLYSHITYNNLVLFCTLLLISKNSNKNNNLDT